MIEDITPEYDTKLQTLFDLISKKIEHPINEGNKKILIFSAFSDTADYLYENVSAFVKKIWIGYGNYYRYYRWQINDKGIEGNTQQCTYLLLTIIKG